MVLGRVKHNQQAGLTESSLDLKNIVCCYIILTKFSFVVVGRVIRVRKYVIIMHLVRMLSGSLVVLSSSREYGKIYNYCLNIGTVSGK